MRRILFSLLFIFKMNAFCLNSIDSGEWSSGGAHNVELNDQSNPWFIQNTKKVSYCILHDEINFGAGREDIQESIKVAIDYWKKSLKLSFDSFSRQLPYPLFQVATQDFLEVDCSEEHQMRFQFGVLDDEQKEYFKHEPFLLATATKTHYDRKNLTSRGFIYIIPEKGPLAPTNIKLKNNLWLLDKNVYLKAALIHELGHVFGIAHTQLDVLSSKNSTRLFMNADFTLEIVKEKGHSFSHEYLKDPYFEMMPTLSKKYVKCGILENIHLLSSLQSSRCMKLEFPSTEKGEIQVSLSDSPNSEWTNIGYFSVEDNIRIHSFKIPLVISDREQKVLPNPENYTYIYGKYSAITQSLKVGRFHSKDSSKDNRYYKINIYSDSLSFTMVNENGEILEDLFPFSRYSSIN